MQKIEQLPSGVPPCDGGIRRGGEGTRLTAHQAALAAASASRRSSDENLEAFRLLTLQARDRGIHDPAQGIHTEGLR